MFKFPALFMNQMKEHDILKNQTEIILGGSLLVKIRTI